MDQLSPVPACSRLTLRELRSYRRSLDDEENRVSYWRAVIQGRADVTEAGDALGGNDSRALERVLSAGHNGTKRTSVLRLSAGDDVPPFPGIAALWTQLDRPADPATRCRLVADLRRLEAQLSAYRRDLHWRIETATAEAVRRYHSEPSLCLSVLPRPRQRAG